MFFVFDLFAWFVLVLLSGFAVPLGKIADKSPSFTKKIKGLCFGFGKGFMLESTAKLHGYLGYQVILL